LLTPTKRFILLIYAVMLVGVLGTGGCPKAYEVFLSTTRLSGTVERVRLVIAGPGSGILMDIALALCEQVGMEEQVRCLDMLDDVPGHQGDFSIFLWNSSAEDISIDRVQSLRPVALGRDAHRGTRAKCG
jgi:hypothetical protein